jgi:shikimate dehydrogenase
MQIISGRTRICGVIGDPIEHSMSPVMLSAAFRDKGVNYVDIPFRVRKEELGNAIKGMRALNIRGLNVTIPHKVSVIQFLDEVDSVASKIGAVNTIVNNGGILKGYNTDATGFLQALRERGVEPKGKKVVMLGAGGAARAISFILAESGSNVVIINRTLDRAKVCADRVAQSSQRKVIALKLDRENLASALSKADLLVNTTSVGMSPKINETPVTADLLKPNLVVCDIVYNPLKTRLLREAEMVGATVIDGVDMFVWQGALAFEKWTGLSAPIALMKREVIKVLERDEN